MSRINVLFWAIVTAVLVARSALGQSSNMVLAQAESLSQSGPNASMECAPLASPPGSDISSYNNPPNVNPLAAGLSFATDWGKQPTAGGWRALQIINSCHMHVDSSFKTEHGLPAVRIEVDRNDDPLGLGENTEREEAALMQEPSGIIYETSASGTQFYALSYYFPTRWAASQYPYSVFETPGSTWPYGVSSNCYQNSGNDCNSWSFVMQFYGWGGALMAARTSVGGPEHYAFYAKGKLYEFSDGGAIALGKWTDFVFELVWSTGKITIWRRDQGQTGFRQVVNAMAGPPSGSVYFKQGLYRGGQVNGRSDVLWVGPTARGSSFTAVEKQAFRTSTGQPTNGYAWPGQPGNPVGYAAYAPLGTTVWTGGSLQSGTPQNPTVYNGYIFNGVTISVSNVQFISCDFNSGANPLLVEGSNISFIGSRFQSNSVQYTNVVLADGASNISFSYDSFTPLATYYTSPPGEVWPSAGAGMNTYTQVPDVNAINGNKGYQMGLWIGGTNGGPVTVDHSDFWGFGNAIVLNQSTAQMTFTNNWIHDAADASPQGYHTDGIGYLNGGAGPSNVLIEGNTIASMGNSNGIAFQAATSGYNNMQIIHNYLSGFGYTVAPGTPGNVHFTNSSFVDNVLGTDIRPWWGPLYAWTQTGNVWKCNTVHVIPSTTWSTGNWTPTTAQDGLYWVPTSNVTSSTDWQGNASCP
jgi:hypothetical protein